MPRKYRIVHESYLVEWLGFNYPAGTWRTNVRLGRLADKLWKEATPEERRMLRGAFGAQADAIVLLEDRAIIVEVMVRHEPGVLEDLEKYELLFRETEEFREWWEKPIEKVLVTPLDLPFYERLAAEKGIKVVKYKPIWIREYLATYAPKYRRGMLSAVEYPPKQYR